jgi:hypothetical protein
MTRLPVESRLCVDRPDLPEYELNRACPVTGEVTGLEAHHIWRRSAGYPSWWVELPDGEVVGNRIMLSSQAHYRVTINKARIVFDNTVFYWEENGERTALRWQPPTMHRRKQDTVKHEYIYDSDGVLGPTFPQEHSIEPGHDCPTCRRRVPLPKKPSSPKTKVFSTRVPIDDVDTFREILGAAAEHSGLKAKAYHEYNTLLVGLTLILQATKEDLPDVG